MHTTQEKKVITISAAHMAPVFCRRRFSNDPVKILLLAVSVISLYFWIRCSYSRSNSSFPSERQRSKAQISLPVLPGFCVRCRDTPFENDFTLERGGPYNNITSDCEIIESDPKKWLFPPVNNEKILKSVPAWFRNWDEYQKMFPVASLDLTSRKAVIVPKNYGGELGGDGVVLFRYLTNPGLLATVIKNHTMSWRLDMTAPFFKRQHRYESLFDRGSLAEHWHDGLRQRFVAQNKWYRLIESGIKESDFVEKGTEKKMLRQWKSLIELTMSKNYLPELEQSDLSSTFDYSVPFSRSIRPLKKFLKKYRLRFVENKRVLILGSTYPWIETEVFLNGASHVTTATEFDLIKRSLPENHPHFSYVHIRRLANLIQRNVQQFDLVISFSYIEHVGLGRYGDPLNPDADLMEMAKLSCLVKPGGLMLLSVPVDGDCLEYSYRRFYGPVRYSLITECWRLVEFESFNIGDCKTRDWTYQPWFVLQNLRRCPISGSSPLTKQG